MPRTLPSTRPPGEVPEPTVGHPLRLFWRRHRVFFWNLHSIWALAAGGMVIFLAEERYGFVPWVILFLIVTWASTLLFSRAIALDGALSDPAEPPDLHREVASYLTRMMYQGTLFFLLPFYWYSTVVRSPNVVFSILLMGLALLSCVDLLFDRWLRTHPWFGFVYFATVTFAAINLLLPLLLPVDPAEGTPIAALVAVGCAIPLAVRGSLSSRSSLIRSTLTAILFLLVFGGLPRLVPPVPLRLKNVTFAPSIDRTTLVAGDHLGFKARSGQLGGEIFILVEVFSPSVLPTSVSLEWTRDGEVIRISRDIKITAHEEGFRVWDGYRSGTERIPAGKYEVTFRTLRQRCFGVAQIDVIAE